MREFVVPKTDTKSLGRVRLDYAFRLHARFDAPTVSRTPKGDFRYQDVVSGRVTGDRLTATVYPDSGGGYDDVDVVGPEALGRLQCERIHREGRTVFLEREEHAVVMNDMRVRGAPAQILHAGIVHVRIAVRRKQYPIRRGLGKVALILDETALVRNVTILKMEQADMTFPVEWYVAGGQRVLGIGSDAVECVWTEAPDRESNRTGNIGQRLRFDSRRQIRQGLFSIHGWLNTLPSMPLTPCSAARWPREHLRP